MKNHSIDIEYRMPPGRSGSLKFFMTPGGFVGPGEPYTIDQSEYKELHPYKDITFQ